MPIKQWDVNIKALTPSNTHPNPEHTSLVSFCYETANASFCANCYVKLVLVPYTMLGNEDTRESNECGCGGVG